MVGGIANVHYTKRKESVITIQYFPGYSSDKMVIGGFPLAKLTGVLIRQISKPLANFAKERAKTNHFFRTYICMPPAQLYHWYEVRMKMYVMNLGKPASKSEIPKLNEQAAIELGANLLGEGLLFSVAVIVLVVEYNRQKANEKLKERGEKNHLIELEQRINDLAFANEELDTKIRELTRLLYSQKQQVNNQTPVNTAHAVKSKDIITTAVETAQLKIRT